MQKCKKYQKRAYASGPKQVFLAKCSVRCHRYHPILLTLILAPCCKFKISYSAHLCQSYTLTDSYICIEQSFLYIITNKKGHRFCGKSRKGLRPFLRPILNIAIITAIMCVVIYQIRPSCYTVDFSLNPPQKSSVVVSPCIIPVCETTVRV